MAPFARAKKIHRPLQVTDGAGVSPSDNGLTRPGESPYEQGGAV